MKLNPIEQSSNTEKRKNYPFEVLQRFSTKIEEKHLDSILECLDRTLKNAELIGEGNNAEILKLKRPWTSICVKVFKKGREVINDFDQEFEFQQKVNDLNIRTPENLLSIENRKTKQQYLLMERIDGLSLNDLLLEKNKQKYEDFKNHSSSFFMELQNNIGKMHRENIHHRDLHSGNVMFDFKSKNPIIIDFGHATQVFSDDEDRLIYSGTTTRISEETGRKVFIRTVFPRDMEKIKELKSIFSTENS